MRICRLPVLVVVLASLAAPAHAEAPPAHAEAPPASHARHVEAPPASHARPIQAPRTTPGEGRALPRIALGVSVPWGWFADRFGISGYVGINAHSALRANLAWYGESKSFVDYGSLFVGAESPSRSGRIADYGLAWVWYPRRLWDGFTLEAGLLRRDRDVSERSEEDTVVHTSSTTYAGRAMLGWSWRIAGYAYLAVAVGLSAGRESGTEEIVPGFLSDDMAATRPIARLQVDGEGYFRFGFAFGR